MRIPPQFMGKSSFHRPPATIAAAGSKPAGCATLIVPSGCFNCAAISVWLGHGVKERHLYCLALVGGESAHRANNQGALFGAERSSQRFDARGIGFKLAGTHRFD